jgi:hypothetical protein
VTVSESEITMLERVRLFADWLEAHPAAEPASITIREGAGEAYEAVLDAETLAERARAIGGRWAKHSAEDDYFTLRQGVVPGVVYYLFAARERVCARVVVGTAKVMEPAPDGPMVEVEREIVEWRCPESLLAIGGTA